MISRFFKKKPKTPEPKAPEPKKKTPEAPKALSPKAKPSPYKKLLTAEGWKRMMMRKTGKAKK